MQKKQGHDFYRILALLIFIVMSTDNGQQTTDFLP